jgi:hypothetical protein
MFFTAVSKGEVKKRGGSVPSTGDGFQCILQGLQDESDLQKDSLSCLRELGIVLNGQQAQVDQDASHLHDLPQ